MRPSKRVIDLTPFWNSETTYWESSQVTTTGVLGYSYPEFNGLDMGDADTVRREITRKINQLYSDFTPLSFSDQQDSQTVGVNSALSTSTPDSTHLSWTARIHIKKYELCGSFSVLFFIGEVPENPADWYSCPSFAGAHGAFVNSATEGCANCARQQEADVDIEAFVHLNNTLARILPNGSYDEEVVEPVLKEKLQWRVRKVC